MTENRELLPEKLSSFSSFSFIMTSFSSFSSFFSFIASIFLGLDFVCEFVAFERVCFKGDKILSSFNLEVAKETISGLPATILSFATSNNLSTSRTINVGVIRCI